MADQLPPLPPGAQLNQTAQMPPLPPGAKLASVPDHPPLPKGAVPALPQQPESFLHKEGREIGQSFMDIPQEMSRQATSALNDIKGDITSPVQSHDKAGKAGVPGFLDYAARVGKTALDVGNYIQSPVSGALTSVVGRPVEKVTGIPKQTTGDILSMAIPFAGDIKAAIKSPEVIDGAKAFQKVFSPTSVSPGAGVAERTIRRATGENDLEAQRAAAKIVEGNKVVSNLPEQQQLQLIDYIENRSKLPGMKLKNAALQDTADKIADVYNTYKTRIQKIIPATANQQFINDYFVHMWKDKPSIVSEKMGAYFKQGSGRNLKTRSIPTIADGIKAGLTPITTNPIEATSMYAQNMSRFLSTHDIQNELKAQGYAKWYSPGSENVPKGWVPLKGILTQKATPITKATKTGARIINLYAPPDVARVYNNFISRGAEGSDAGPIFAGARKLANGLTMLKLGLSPFHLDTMANESITSGFARAFKNLSKGDVKGAAKAAGTAVMRPGIDYKRGMKMQQELLNVKTPDAISQKVNDAFIRSGGRLKMDPFYRTRASGSFFNAIEKGTFRKELKDATEKMYKGTPYQNAKGIVDMAGNLIQTTAAPLFEKYIPAVKRGAFASTMEDWLRANPNATQDEIDKYAIKLSDSIDNRFGELVQDNLFWNRWLKQIAQIVLLSPSWDLGTVREIGGGIKDALHAPADIIKGKGISDRTAYVAGLATEVALKNAIYNYIKTGQEPQGKDFMAARTGGRDISSGEPERVMTPGYEKDVYAFGYDFPHNVLTESANKLNPALSAATGLLMNKDYRGLPIYRPEGVPASTGGQGLSDYLLDQLMPISMGSMNKGKKGSNIGPIERMLLADRPAPEYITAPQRVEQLKKKYNTREWRQKLRADQRQQSQQQ